MAFESQVLFSKNKKKNGNNGLITVNGPGKINCLIAQILIN